MRESSARIAAARSCLTTGADGGGALRAGAIGLVPVAPAALQSAVFLCSTAGGADRCREGGGTLGRLSSQDRTVGRMVGTETPKDLARCSTTASLSPQSLYSPYRSSADGETKCPSETCIAGRKLSGNANECSDTPLEESSSRASPVGRYTTVWIVL